MGTMFGYTPATSVAPPSLLWTLADRKQHLSTDRAGFLGPTVMRARVFHDRVVKLTCEVGGSYGPWREDQISDKIRCMQLYLAKPVSARCIMLPFGGAWLIENVQLAYARGTAVPIVMWISCADSAALALLAPDALSKAVRLRRHVWFDPLLAGPEVTVSLTDPASRPDPITKPVPYNSACNRRSSGWSMKASTKRV
ncbi:hypothetical protein PUNSTDRAFT_120242 [Punctularia strigosozonata HHB-11173 SS5]|uniref:uncharacterized protein n=1 Tax=Punctularia strigosozonata (strain HHB-11173) TaxID=741275 RepID=UPI0004417EB0|nr:uncharacterized protein PUNSTDRAFT_120242 [Punctularia strigosozonata HHB-11173 SS5]EIN10024.1 hypothetical protein PUNSTDRAFT_120242 [Punctularia strigosozonata HHB-11173 SS5]